MVEVPAEAKRGRARMVALSVNIVTRCFEIVGNWGKIVVWTELFL